METRGLSRRLQEQKAKQKKVCEPLDQGKLTGEPPRKSKSSVEVEQGEKRNYLNQTLMNDRREKKRAYCRHYSATLTIEQREKRNARQRERLSMLTDEQRERRNARQRLKRSMLTDEERERRNALERENRSMWTEELREKIAAYKRNRLLTFTAEQRERLNARRREQQSMRTEEQRKKRAIYDRNRWLMATDEERERKNGSKKRLNRDMTDENKERRRPNQRRHCVMNIVDEQQEKTGAFDRENEVRISLKKLLSKKEKEHEQRKVKTIDRERKENLVDCTSYIQRCNDVECPVKLAPEAETNGESHSTSDRVKYSHVANEQCETIAVVNAEGCISQGGELEDNFEECEDWLINIKKEYDGGE